MADEIDQANYRAQAALDASIEATRQAASAIDITGTGGCLHCGE